MLKYGHVHLECLELSGFSPLEGAHLSIVLFLLLQLAQLIYPRRFYTGKSDFYLQYRALSSIISPKQCIMFSMEMDCCKII